MIILSVILILIVVLAYVVEIPEMTSIQAISGSEVAPSIIALTVKVALVVAWLQVIRFVSKNYFARKHLHQTTEHKAVILQCLHAIYDNTDDSDKKEALLMIGATETFRAYETGIFI